jgi:hypothetical protein
MRDANQKPRLVFGYKIGRSSVIAGDDFFCRTRIWWKSLCKFRHMLRKLGLYFALLLPGWEAQQISTKQFAHQLFLCTMQQCAYFDSFNAAYHQPPIKNMHLPKPNEVPLAAQPSPSTVHLDLRPPSTTRSSPSLGRLLIVLTPPSPSTPSRRSPASGRSTPARRATSTRPPHRRRRRLHHHRRWRPGHGNSHNRWRLRRWLRSGAIPRRNPCGDNHERRPRPSLARQHCQARSD